MTPVIEQQKPTQVADFHQGNSEVHVFCMHCDRVMCSGKLRDPREAVLPVTAMATCVVCDEIDKLYRTWVINCPHCHV